MALMSMAELAPGWDYILIKVASIELLVGRLYYQVHSRLCEASQASDQLEVCQDTVDSVVWCSFCAGLPLGGEEFLFYI